MHSAASRSRLAIDPVVASELAVLACPKSSRLCGLAKGGGASAVIDALLARGLEKRRKREAVRSDGGRR